MIVTGSGNNDILEIKSTGAGDGDTLDEQVEQILKTFNWNSYTTNDAFLRILKN